MKKKLLLLPLLLLTSCNSKEYKTPIEWCYLDVITNYDDYYEEDIDLPYSYKEIHAFTNYNDEWYEDINIKIVYDYEITIYTEDKADVYIGGIGFNTISKTNKYSAKQCVEIDMDYIYSFVYE